MNCDNDDEPAWVNDYVQKQKFTYKVEKAEGVKLLQDKQEQQRANARKLSSSSLCKKEKHFRHKVRIKKLLMLYLNILNNLAVIKVLLCLDILN